jgi:hypothetical protein
MSLQNGGECRFPSSPPPSKYVCFDHINKAFYIHLKKHLPTRLTHTLYTHETQKIKMKRSRVHSLIALSGVP